MKTSLVAFAAMLVIWGFALGYIAASAARPAYLDQMADCAAQDSAHVEFYEDASWRCVEDSR